MLGFELDFWDYATFATAAMAGVAVRLIYIRIVGTHRQCRNHPDAEAVKLMGWATIRRGS